MIRQAAVQDTATISALAHKLWPHDSLQALEAGFASLLSHADSAVFLYFMDSRPVAFAQCQLRNDYVEGTSSSPVAYLEGIYVAEEYRRRGIAAALLSQCEQWAKAKGCSEFASDCELNNADSLCFHLHAGFAEANRIICFTKRIGG